MQYINPIELFYLQNIDPSSLTVQDIRKAKKKLIADIELSDSGSIIYRGKELFKADIEDAFELLDTRDNRINYHYLAMFSALNNFLATGHLGYFEGGQHQQLKTLTPLPSFLKLVSPYFAEQFNSALTLAFRNKDEIKLKKLLNSPMLVTSDGIDKAYRGVMSELRKRLARIEAISQEVKERKINDFELDTQIEKRICTEVEIDLLNLFHNYFQPVRNQFAMAIRSVAIDVFNEYSNASLSIMLINMALSVKVDGLSKDKLIEDKKQIDDIVTTQRENDYNESIFLKYGEHVKGLVKVFDQIQAKTILPSTAQVWVDRNISVHDINQLDGRFSEIKNQISAGLRALSVAIWNLHNNIDAAIYIINKASQIDVSDAEINDSIKRDKMQLNVIKNQQTRPLPTSQRPISTPQRSTPQYSAPGTSNSNGGLYVFLGFIAFVLLIIFVDSGSKTYTPTNSDERTSTIVTTDSTMTMSSDTTLTMSSDTAMGMSSEPAVNSYQESQLSAYAGNQLNNGDSPFNSCFSQGIYEGQAYIVFENSNDYDAVVCLVEVYSGRTVRNEYIRAGSDFKMSRIPTGTYYLKVYYGKDWNPKKQNFCGTYGGFETGEHFSKSDDTTDYLQVENSEFSYSTGRVTLYTVPGGNMSTESTNASDFFNH
ncbi:hypothetical protein [Fibrivirga algicola]|uniref:Uncharacterized protein n=1 Tax=Fibrivirga algicola TaxID=2950420 RepID=A0ABX0QQT1_9BACT|nr:hypothetical protein [Fibrivirga algicola]NID13515.1 hypothetical protein [Fibrivirga algicola]